MSDTEKEIQNLPLPADPSEPPEPRPDSQRAKYASAIALGVPIGIVLGLWIFDSAALGAAMSLVLIPIVYFVLSKWNGQEL